MTYSHLTQLIQYLEEFEKEHKAQKLEDFVIWLNNQLFTGKDEAEHEVHDDLMIAFKLIHINKALKKKVKGALTDSKIASIDEYSFLLHLDYQNSFRKMEITNLHSLEAPTGIEIIKRLVSNNFVEEFPDEEDKRAKRIKLTDKGRQELSALKPKIDELFTRFVAPLNLRQKVNISGLLDQLDH